ncbi:hypothetical protein A946_00120 [Methylacidiphilum kamchatkense Kam1]|uniref:Uncharacterized protein n=1 Tax=Methylacidiphilum kamchatkense Kam1 TaxID=1202785 RepID=A0A0C1UTT7_9BACT|nr:hypothetical protein A946_00120 [Methylacidiphilum kamchatkense Kam1]QDQ42862.1 hypothetical protein kam1_1647 [Methylacidiphilum kamchatkense Kam1]
MLNILLNDASLRNKMGKASTEIIKNYSIQKIADQLVFAFRKTMRLKNKRKLGSELNVKLHQDLEAY